MAIVAMRHLRLIGLQSEREEMLRRLQHLGCLEITEPELAEDDLLLEKLRIPEGSGAAKDTRAVHRSRAGAANIDRSHSKGKECTGAASVH